VRYGTVLPDDADVIAHVLAPQYRRLDERLAQLDGAVELSLKATYHERPVLEEVLREHPDLARPLGGAGGGGRGGGGRGARSGRGGATAAGAATYHARIELGRRVVAAIQAKQEQERRRLLESVGAHVREVRLREPTSELMFLNASVLLDRAKLDDFDRALERAAAREANRVRLECVGPLSPFSFAELRI
jgi:hypothetical protein